MVDIEASAAGMIDGEDQKKHNDSYNSPSVIENVFIKAALGPTAIFEIGPLILALKSETANKSVADLYC